MKRKHKVMIIAFILAVTSLYTIIYAVPGVKNALKKTMILEYGTLLVEDEVTGYIVREETVYLSETTGKVEYFIEEGTKVRQGVRILNISPISDEEKMATLELKDIKNRIGAAGTTQTINDAPITGLVGYFIDGYESVFTPENMTKLERAKVEDFDKKTYNLTRAEGTIAKKGEPIYKILDNNQWYLMFWLDKDSGSIAKYTKGESIKSDFQGKVLEGKVHEILEQKDDWLIILSFDRYYQDLPKLRSIDVRVISAEYEGLIVENKNLITEDQVIGLYVKKRNGEFVFEPVNIIKSSGNYAIISMDKFNDKDGNTVETVKIYEEILRDPKSRK